MKRRAPSISLRRAGRRASSAPAAARAKHGSCKPNRGHGNAPAAVPAAFEAGADMTADGLGRLSVSLSVVVVFTYVLFLTFALVTHPALFAGSAAEEEKAHASVGRSLLVLTVATVGIAWMSEIMVGAIEPTTREFGFSS